MEHPTASTVLIVEDDSVLLTLACIMIEGAGFAVATATNADQAILILEQRTDIRIVFTDIDMPGSMDGLKLARSVRGRWPPIEIIVVSGRQRFHAADLPARAAFFLKPYSPQAILETLHRMAA